MPTLCSLLLNYRTLMASIFDLEFQGKNSELYGNSFMERCTSCRVEYFRDFEVESVGLKETSRWCSNGDFVLKLKDTILNWEDALPLKR
ncbi:hypothetical protein L6452_43364 [Arctium lappa]|uniref:Uncharacterized protein n=1 Tax=Arctium lappa TaxID=4217 RepID=A0ACB8XLE8_ARCLA|nr:hypothetical protein L6452_43364 [Arctium lappa]